MDRGLAGLAVALLLPGCFSPRLPDEVGDASTSGTTVAESSGESSSSESTGTPPSPESSGVAEGTSSSTEGSTDETGPATESSSETGEPVQRCPDGMAFVPGGTFTLADAPQLVSIESFCIDIVPVTAAAYAACASCSPANGDDPSNPATYCNDDIAFRGNDPANCVDFSQAQFYCTTNDKALPSEEQWEWAARGGDAARIFPWGDTVPAASDAPPRLCWAAGRNAVTWPERPQGTCPVGEFDQGETHPWGLEDMAGNIWHWTTTDAATPSGKVVRGGGWDNTDPNRVRTGFRNTGNNDAGIRNETRHSALGFRCIAPPLE